MNLIIKIQQHCIYGREKKDIKLFKKLILQIVACLLIYFIFYTINNSDYFFTEDFINKAKEILAYDINFEEIYNNVNSTVTTFFNSINNEKNEENLNNKDKENSNQNSENTNDLSNNSADDDANNSNNNSNTNNSSSNNSNNDYNSTDSANSSNIDNNFSDTNGATENNINSNETNIGGAIETANLTEEEQQILEIKNTTTFIKPVNGTISSRYGIRNPTTSTVPKNHTGTDIAANLGTKIIASTDGKVILASSQGDYGNHLKIQIGNVITVYAHCNKLYVKEGDEVKQGQEIAEVGSTGNSTGPHLHFEIRLNNKTVNPEDILEL